MLSSLECVFSPYPASLREIWTRIADVIPQNILSDHVEFCGNQLKTQNLFRALDKRTKPHFGLRDAHIEISFTTLESYELSLLTIDHDSAISLDWWKIMAGLFDIAFISGRVFDHDKEYWDNAHDPLQFTSAGRGFGHLPMKSNGLPPPLEQQIIDTSGNPRRRHLRIGYVEAIGDVMWLSNTLFSRTGGKKEDVRRLSSLVEMNEVSNGIDRLTLTRDLNNEEFESLRSAIFPRFETGAS